MGLVIALSNPKGGVGRTAVAVNLGACLAALGRRVLLVDLDPLECATRTLGLPPAGPESAGFLLDDGAPLLPARPSSAPGLEVVSSGSAAVDLEPLLARRDDRLERVRRALERPLQAFDLALIDPPPGAGLLARSALAAARVAIVPVRCEPFAREALAYALEEVRQVKKRLNPELGVLGIALNAYDDQVPSCSDSAARIREAFEHRVLDAVLPRDPAVQEAASRGLAVVQHDPASRAAWAFIELAREVVRVCESLPGGLPSGRGGRA